MSEHPHAVIMADDAEIGQMIDRAQRRLIVVVPGLSVDVAEALAQRWRLLGADAVSVTLDVDPEVCRLGYGEIAAVELLSKTARELETTLNSHPGIRIGVVISDDETLIYAPTPRFIEAGPATAPNATPAMKPNAIRLGLPPAELERDLGAGPDGVRDRIVGLDVASQESIERVAKDLKVLPPQPFDVSRRLRVYAARLEFVELRMHGWNLSRRTVTLPPELVSVLDSKNRSLLESKFRVLARENAREHFEHVERIRDFIVKQFVVYLKGYGALIRIKDKPGFERAVSVLRKMLDRSCKRAIEKLTDQIKQNVTAMVEALLPIVQRNPPQELRHCLVAIDMRAWLTAELKALVGRTEDLFEHAVVVVRYKGLTYDTLRDPTFVEAVKELMPDMQTLHEESDAAPMSRWA